MLTSGGTVYESILYNARPDTAMAKVGESNLEVLEVEDADVTAEKIVQMLMQVT